MNIGIHTFELVDLIEGIDVDAQLQALRTIDELKKEYPAGTEFYSCPDRESNCVEIYIKTADDPH